MKRFVLVAAVWLAAAAIAAAEGEIAVGDPRSHVLDVLGPPAGFLVTDDAEVFYYFRGEVALRNGIVTRHTLLPEEDARRARELEAREVEEYRRAEAEKRERRTAEGRAIRDERLTDFEFQKLPSRVRLAFWETFRRKYPEVDVDLPHALALEEFRAGHDEEIENALAHAAAVRHAANAGPVYEGTSAFFSTPARSIMKVKPGRWAVYQPPLPIGSYRSVDCLGIMPDGTSRESREATVVRREVDVRIRSDR